MGAVGNVAVTVGVAAVDIVVKNLDRGEITITADKNNVDDIWIMFGKDAEIDKGTPLEPGDVLIRARGSKEASMPIGRISGISGTAAQQVFVLELDFNDADVFRP